MKTKVIMAAVLEVSVSACTLVPKTVEPIVSLNPQQSTIGNDRPVLLAVVDERPDRQLGKRGFGNAASVTVTGDLQMIVKDALTRALETKGFKLEAEGNRTLRVEIRGLEFSESQQILTVGHRASAAVHAEVRNDDRVVYERLYRSDESGAGVFAAGGNTIQEQVSDALTGALRNLINDPQLLMALAQK